MIFMASGFMNANCIKYLEMYTLAKCQKLQITVIYYNKTLYYIIFYIILQHLIIDLATLQLLSTLKLCI